MEFIINPVKNVQYFIVLIFLVKNRRKKKFIKDTARKIQTYLNLFEPPAAGLQLEIITKMSIDFRIELAKLPYLVV